MTDYQFVSSFRNGRSLGPHSQAAVKAEPMLFNADPHFAYEVGGPITRDFLDTLGAIPEGAVVDTRVHMLMPGWFPCIPGWHHDDIPRTRPDGQPDYRQWSDPPQPGQQLAQHVLALVGGDIAPTEFAIGTIKLPHIPEGIGPVYKHWNRLVEAATGDGTLVREAVQTNRLIHFDSHAFHRGTAAVRSGWRWFGRVSWNTTRKPTNELRTQVQVYMPDPMEGW